MHDSKLGMTTMFKRFTVLGCVLMLTAACKDKKDEDEEHEESAPAPDCQAITDACHTVDDGKPGSDIYECHSEIAHENVATRCAEERDRCVALCEAAQ